MYVLRNIAYGGAEGELFIPEAPQLSDIFEPSGTLEDWQKNVAIPSLGNPLLELAIAFAFTGPLLEPCGLEGAGLHVFGPSSCSKTTALHVAGSVCGGGGKYGYIRQWRATDNALEGTVATHCDNLLCLDEIGQASSRVVSEVAYMLANGQGKARANKDGNAKAIREWRLSFMSTGELTLADKIAEDGRGQVMAGQPSVCWTSRRTVVQDKVFLRVFLMDWMVIYSINSWLEPQDNFMEPHSEDSSNVLSMGSKNMSLTSKKRLPTSFGMCARKVLRDRSNVRVGDSD